MRKWLWVVLTLLLAACSKNRQPTGSTQTVQAAHAAPAAAPGNAEPAVPPVVATPVETVIPTGTLLRVRLDRAIRRAGVRGDEFTATLAAPVVVNGQSVLPTGTQLSGHVLVSTSSGRLKGRARLVLVLDSFMSDGHRHTLAATAASRVSSSHKKRNLVAIGGGSGTGAAVGAIAAGGAGAVIGAGAGAVAGTVGAAVTGRKQVTLPAETLVRFTLRAPVRV